MKDLALDAAMRFDDPGRRLNALREHLQAFVMRSLHESEASRALAFVGGTALRFLENLPRFSEDLDFSRIASDEYDPAARDVEPFLQRPADAGLLDRANLEAVLAA